MGVHHWNQNVPELLGSWNRHGLSQLHVSRGEESEDKEWRLIDEDTFHRLALRKDQEEGGDHSETV